MNLRYAVRPHSFALAILALLLQIMPLAAAQQRADSIGIFDAHGDVGDNPRKGSASYDAATGEYRVTGGGANMWGPVDALD